MLWPQSLYELTKNFTTGISLFYSSSTGSIKRALDRLLAEGLIQVESVGGPRGRRTYAITEAGREEFHRWMLENNSSGDFETSALARSYFLGLIPADDRVTVADRIRARIRAELTQLEQLAAHADSQEIPQGLEDVAQYQLATLSYGLASLRTAAEWAERHLPQASAPSDSAVG